jgi:hypothetical protein
MTATKGGMEMVKHLASGYVNITALCLDKDVYGANGDKSDEEIRDHLIRKIHEDTDYQHYETGLIPVGVVALPLKSLLEEREKRNGING